MAHCLSLIVSYDAIKDRLIYGLRPPYIVIAGKIEYRLFYDGYEKGKTIINVPGAGNSFSRAEEIGWPRIICIGPFEKAPYPIIQKGFQGFRYCTKLVLKKLNFTHSKG